jgi:hypothetical protein
MPKSAKYRELAIWFRLPLKRLRDNFSFAPLGLNHFPLVPGLRRGYSILTLRGSGLQSFDSSMPAAFERPHSKIFNHSI